MKSQDGNVCFKCRHWPGDDQTTREKNKKTRNKDRCEIKRVTVDIYPFKIHLKLL